MTTTDPVIARWEGLVDHDPVAGQTTVYATDDAGQPIALALDPGQAEALALSLLHTPDDQEGEPSEADEIISRLEDLIDRTAKASVQELDPGLARAIARFHG